MGATQRKCVRSWVFDVAVATSGIAVGIGALIWLLTHDHFDTHWAMALLVGPPVLAVMSRFPLVLNRSATGIEVGFESAVLVFLACFDGGHGALAVWAVGQALSQATSQKRVDVRFFNVGIGVLSGGAALLVMRSVSDLDRTSPQELLAVALGCAAFFLVDYVISALSIALEEGTALTAALRQSSAWIGLSIFVAIDSLGYLAALVTRALPAWATVLLGVPLITILVASRALSRGEEHRRRLEALFDAAADAQTVATPDELRDLLRRYARAAVAQKGADLRETEPGPKEVGARVRAGRGVLWLVAPAVDRARASVQADKKALEALAAVGEESFSRLALTKEMGHLARHDALTSLPNRTVFLDRVEHAVLRSQRSGEGLAVLFLDLDGFKGVNDRFGHAEGDALLQTVGKRLLHCVRPDDTVARLGGDEFAVLVEGVDGVRGLDVLCRRLLDTLRSGFSVLGHEVVVGASIGVALADEDDDAVGLLRNADMAMYRAKALGKDRYFVYQPALREENVRRLELVEALRREMATCLVVHYQPVIDLVTGRIDGMEALVRWQRVEGLIPPDAFIAAAEDSGLIGELGGIVLAQVTADAPLLQEAAGHALSLGVNMSAHQLRSQEFIQLVRDAVTAVGENQLVLEMTETVVVDDDEATDEAMQALKAAGARLAIDDFGVGFSSIGYLQHLPVDVLKIDRSFTRDVDSDPRAAALVEAILVMAGALDLRVVAEGIERPEQAAQLQALGCSIGQGYLYGRPQPLGDVLGLLRDRCREEGDSAHSVDQALARPRGFDHAR